MFNKNPLAPDADFLISSSASDHAWAEWIAWQLEEARYTVIYEGWFPPGTNRVIALNQKVRCTIAILSTEYLDAIRIDNNRVNQEDRDISSIMWLGAIARDPSGRQGYLLPVQVSQCQPSGLLANLVRLDFIGLDEENAREKLLAAVRPKNDISRLGRFGTHQTILLLSPSNTAPCLTQPVCSKYNQIHPKNSDHTSYARLPDTDTNQGHKVAEFLKRTFSPLGLFLPIFVSRSFRRGVAEADKVE